jgi:hypothetical protein
LEPTHHDRAQPAKGIREERETSLIEIGSFSLSLSLSLSLSQCGDKEGFSLLAYRNNRTAAGRTQVKQYSRKELRSSLGFGGAQGKGRGAQ